MKKRTKRSASGKTATVLIAVATLLSAVCLPLGLAVISRPLWLCGLILAGVSLFLSVATLLRKKTPRRTKRSAGLCALCVAAALAVLFTAYNSRLVSRGLRVKINDAGVTKQLDPDDCKDAVSSAALICACSRAMPGATGYVGADKVSPRLDSCDSVILKSVTLRLINETDAPVTDPQLRPDWFKISGRPYRLYLLLPDGMPEKVDAGSEATVEITVLALLGENEALINETYESSDEYAEYIKDDDPLYRYLYLFGGKYRKRGGTVDKSEWRSFCLFGFNDKNDRNFYELPELCATGKR